MLTVLLVLHLLTAIFLVSLILMQRSEGGALSGLGGGTGANSFLNARGKGNLLTRTTAILATVFFITSISLSLYHNNSEVKAVSILDAAPAEENPITLDIPAVPTAEADENAAVSEETTVEEVKEETSVEENAATSEEEAKPEDENSAAEEDTADAKTEVEVEAQAEPKTKPEVPVAK